MITDINLETKTVIKVIVTQNDTPKMHPQSEFEIPTSINIGDMLKTRLY